MAPEESASSMSRQTALRRLAVAEEYEYEYEEATGCLEPEGAPVLQEVEESIAEAPPVPRPSAARNRRWLRGVEEEDVAVPEAHGVDAPPVLVEAEDDAALAAWPAQAEQAT